MLQLSMGVLKPSLDVALDSN